jgi:hypothetical protein
MGTLQSLLLHDEFDFHVLFKAVLDTKWCIGELARLACTCKLARAWVRYQYAQCTYKQLGDFLWNMPSTCTIYGRMVPRKQIQAGQLVWTKCQYQTRQRLRGEHDLFVGICRIDKILPNAGCHGRWLTRLDTLDLTNEQIGAFKDNFRPGKTGVALFPMFDEQTLLIIRRENPVDSDDKEYIKKARFSRVGEV